MSEPVSRRVYRSTRRSEQAAETRRRVLAAAAACFAALGYGRTTLADIAEAADVSVETVKGCGAKRELLLASFEQTFAGVEGQAPLSRGPDLSPLLATESDADLISGSAAFLAAANARASGLWRAFNSAADSDVAIRVALDALQQRRRRDIGEATALLQARGMVSRGSAELRRATDVLSFLTSPEGYEQLVTGAGWSHDDYVAWLADAVRRLVTV